MSIKNITISGIGQEGTAIRRNSMVSYDDLSTITAAGYLNNYANQILPSDEFDVYYNWVDATNSGTYSVFTVSIGAGGVITLTQDNSFITDGSVTYAKIQNLTGNSVLGRVGGSAGVSSSIPATVDGSVLRLSGTSFGFGTLPTAGLADAAVTYAKIQNVAALSIVGRAAGTPGVSAEITASTPGHVLLYGGAGTLTFAPLLAASYGTATIPLAALSAGITPAYIEKLGGKFSNGGGTPSVTVTATGVVPTDIAHAFIESSTNAVAIQKVTPGTNVITVLCSGDPGVSVVAWIASRAAA